MAAPARIPVAPPTLEVVDAELRRWRERLGAASRNVSELSELPAYYAAKAAVGGAGRLAAEARGLVATMDELWQGVLLIGATLDRAEQARKAGTRLWRGEEAAGEAMAILTGASISVDLADTPVLHRSLLAGARQTAVVTPDALLRTMEAAFAKATEQLARITRAAEHAAALKQELATAISALPGDWAARLQAADQPDALDAVDALEALRPAIAAVGGVQAGLASARQDLSGIAALAHEADAAAMACQAAVATTLPTAERDAVPELVGWLDRIGQTLAAGRTEAAAIGLANWRALHDHTAAQHRTIIAASRAALARRDDYRARLGLLRAKRRAHPGAPVAALDEAAERAVAAAPMDLEAAAAALRAYQAALA